MGILFVVSTPIGNLEDITIRALKILFNVDAIACEDTRRTGLLLKKLKEKFGFLLDSIIDENKLKNKPYLISYFEHNEEKRIPEIINALKNGLNVALISDAGTPLISDPGFRLVREVIREGIKVESIPGVSSVIAALTISGLPPDKFIFLGYPPHKKGKRLQLYRNLKKSLEYIDSTVILFEAPHKLIITLEEIMLIFGDIKIVIVKELTKIHEEVRRDSISSFLEYFKTTSVKGEFILLFHLD